MTRQVRDDQHGTRTGYIYGCRCVECTRANTVRTNSVRHSDSLVSDCVTPLGVTSECIKLASQIERASIDLRKVARLANRDERAFARHSARLRELKAERDAVLRLRDAHMAECPAAAIRFGAA